MMQGVKNITIKLGLWAMVFLVGIQIANKAAFTHTHLLADGTIVTHAHIYNKTSDKAPVKQHQHSSLEILFFAQLLLLAGFAGYFILIALQSEKYNFSTRKSFRFYNRLYYIPVLRGPPCL